MALSSSCSGELDAVSSILLVILNSILGIFSFGGNLVVLLAIWQNPSLQSVSNYFIASLAIADLSVGAIVNPLWIARSALNIWENKHFLAVLTDFICLQTLVTTTYGLAMISYDRYLAITAVFKYVRTMTTTRCVLAIISVWIFSFSFGALRFTIQDPLLLPYLWLTVAIVCYMVPFSIIVYCYFHIFREAKRQKRQIEAVRTARMETNNDPNANIRIRRNQKAAFTVGIIIGVYLIFALPSMVIVAIQIITQDDCLKLKITKSWFWGAVISFAASACNPWVYAARSSEFRLAFKSIWSRVVNCIKCS